MSKKRNEIINFLNSKKLNISYLDKKSNDTSESGIKIKQFENNHFLLIIIYLFISLLIINIIAFDNYYFLNKSLFLYRFKNFFNSIKPNSENFLDFFIGFIFYYSFFLILFINLILISLNIIKAQKEKKRKNKRNNHLYSGKEHPIDLILCNNFRFNGKKEKTNILVINYNKIYHNKRTINFENKRNKGKKNLIRNEIYFKKFIAFAKYIVLLIALNNIFVNNKISSIKYNSYNITLKVKGTGIKQVISNQYFLEKNYPDEVMINGIKQEKVTYNYYLNQTVNYIELIWSNLISDCRYMFYECTNIIELNFENFNTSNVEYMYGMFCNCISLISLNLSNFNTSKVTNMFRMFDGCSSLTSLNLSNFDTSKVTFMHNMFYNCLSLYSLNTTNFNTLNVVNMNSMFFNCYSLISLNLSNFDTSKVINMNSMFYNCSSLISLNLSNFDTSKVTNIKDMFNGCINLEYINMVNFNEKGLIDNYYKDIFKNVPDNIAICINKDNIITKIYPQIKNLACHIEDCSDNYKLKQKKLIQITNECINDCSEHNLYEYNCKCYSKCELEKCLICPDFPVNKELCAKCNDNYYPKENDDLNIGDFFNCYKEAPKGYYFDSNDLIYKKCYYKCETCEINGDDEINNCLKCDIGFNFEINVNNYVNCYANCNYFFYDNFNIYHCIQDEKCPNEYPILIENKKECISGDIKHIENILEDILNYKTNETQEIKEEEEINNYNKIIEIIDSIFTSGSYDLLNIEKGEERTINTEKMTITLTTSENQKNNRYNNMSTIDLGDCEKLLRNHYNLLENETIYMKKLDIVQEGMNIKKIEYDVYRKLPGNNLEKLNLTICGDTKITINIPIEILDNIDKLNTSSGYFNDICYVSTTNDGTDISLNDRKNEYIQNDNLICQEDCDFSEYDSNNNIAKCQCKVKESSSSFADMKINKNKLLENFIDVKNMINFDILFCYRNLLTISGIFYNIGSLIIISIIIFHIISIFIFYIKQLDDIIKKIKDIMLELLNVNSKKGNKYVKINPKINKKNFKRKINNININSKKSNNIIFSNKIKNINKYNNPLKRKQIQSSNKKKNISYNNINKKNLKSVKSNNNKKNFIKLNNIKQKGRKNVKKIMKYNNDEINELSYNLALLYDKRTFCQYYNSLLKSKHSLIFAFCKSDDYNSKIIKIDLFFVEFAMLYTVNALFFNDETMHKIYVNKGTFDFETQIPITIYSSLISMVLDTPLSFLALSNEAIINFKQSKTIGNIKKIGKKISDCLKLKFIAYFITSFIFLLFFWYYISIFGVIYRNTQYHLLKDNLISLGLSLLTPFILYIFPGLLRIPSLSNPQKKRMCLYRMSKILQFF